jgi:Na+/H+ antiporter NhaA
LQEGSRENRRETVCQVIFFFVVGLEIKRESVVGQLSSVRRAALPVAAAAGGMIAPALLYLGLNTGGRGAAGWGIPMATDIAFALGVLAIFGARVPIGLKVFLPAFALANAGVRIDSHIVEALANPISLGIVLGLVIGKPIGIALLSWLAVRSGQCSLPEGVSWSQIVGAGCLAGIGFTMSLFIADLGFDSETLIANAKIGILMASLVSAILGVVLLSVSLPRRSHR